MARLLCAWSLLLLCASPFTAPFSTCDLVTLLAHRTHDIRTTEFGTSVVAHDGRRVEPLAGDEARRVGKADAVEEPLWSDHADAACSTHWPGRLAACDPWQQLSPADVAPPTVLRL